MKRLITLAIIFTFTSPLQANNTDTYEEACLQRQELESRERKADELRKRKNKGMELTAKEQKLLRQYWKSLIAQYHHAPNLK